MRQKANHQSRHADADQADDPHGSIPHASSGLTRHSGRGGFPGLNQALYFLIAKVFPSSYEKLSSSLRRYESEALHSSHPMHTVKDAIKKPFKDHQDTHEQREAQSAKWLPPGVRGLVVGRNSQFFEEEMSDEDLELVGSLEYRATRLLTILLIAVSLISTLYHRYSFADSPLQHILFWIIIPFAIMAIYLHRVTYWHGDFVANGSTQAGNVSETWYSLFQSTCKCDELEEWSTLKYTAAYSSCGLS
jgi:hypothetical protein